MTFQEISMRHMSEHGLERPPEQETDIPEANTRANDKWAQEETHKPKEKVGGPTGWPTDHPGRLTTRGPHRLKLATWRKLIGCLRRFYEVQL